jgi:hypothetical protein
MKTLFFVLVFLLTACTGSTPVAGKHLFILSGQSNMWVMDLNQSFIPAIEKRYGKDNVIIIKDAEGNEPIYRWYKKWRSPAGVKPEQSGELYDRLMAKVYPAIAGQHLQSITFIWMQGETDAKLLYGDLYADSLQGLYQQLQSDLKRKDINFVIGRISDFDMANKVFADWTKIRDAQVNVATSNDRFTWVDTDDLNDNIHGVGRKKNNDLHYSPDGFVILGQRFADSAIHLIEAHRP